MTKSEEYDIISSVEDFVDIAEFMDDPQIDEVLSKVVKMLDKPDAVHPANVARNIVKLEALAFVFAEKAAKYKTFGKAGVEERYKKDLYYTSKESTQRLVDALKYVVRIHEIR